MQISYDLYMLYVEMESGGFGITCDHHNINKSLIVGSVICISRINIM
jgi:hypothetical protein